MKDQKLLMAILALNNIRILGILRKGYYHFIERGRSRTPSWEIFNLRAKVSFSMF